MEMMPIMNIFNEWHAANTSKKIRAGLCPKIKNHVLCTWMIIFHIKNDL